MIDNNTTVSIALIISVAGIVFTYLNYRRGAKETSYKEHERETSEIRERIEMNVKLDNISSTVTDIRTDIKSTVQRQNDMDIRMTKMEQSMKSLHHRLDEHITQHIEVEKDTE